MNNQTLLIYDFKTLYEILSEIEVHLNFKIINIKKIGDFKIKKNYLIISNKNIKDIENQILLKDLPIEITKLIENINIDFLKKNFFHQSEIIIGNYKLNLNSRTINKDNKSLDLTEREANIISFLANSQNPINVAKLQTEVWGHNSKLETHTVETHIYRLRKKVFKKFSDNNFIISSKLGYSIK